MSNLLTLEGKADDLPAFALSGPEARRVTGLSEKTLERHAKAGEPVGRVKVGRRVVFIRSVLESWIASKVQTAATSPTH